jgi:hypothetical protein
VPNASGDPPFVCAGTSCVPNAGVCTTTADCCAGLSCYLTPGSASGTCAKPSVPPGTGGSTGYGGEGGAAPSTGGTAGVPPAACAEYGQQCTTSSDCCNGVPCSGGQCIVTVR